MLDSFARTTFPKIQKQEAPIFGQRRASDESTSSNTDNNEAHDIEYGRKSCYASKLWWIEPNLETIPSDFCQNTSLHGLKYISQPKRHLSERLFWLVTFMIGSSVAVYLISDVWKKYNESPIIVSFDPFETSIDNIPFPAITICNNNKILKSKADVYTQELHDYGDDDAEALINYYYLAEVCLSSKSFSNKFEFSLFEVNDTLAEKAYHEFEGEGRQAEIQTFLRMNSQTCMHMIPLCLFKDEVVKCSEIFNPIVTDFGKCCTFNMIPNLLRDFNNTFQVSPQEILDWNEARLQNSGILTDSDERTKYPYRQTRAGKSYGLSFLLDPDLDQYFCTNSDSYGFKLSIHYSAEIPNSIDFGYGIQPNSEVAVALRPEITKADPSLYSYPLNKRQCYLDNEYNLTYYKHYTVSNCIDECVTEDVYRTCGCVRFYMPRNFTRKLCQPKQFNCTEDAKENFSHSPYGLKKNCPRCLPLCSEISFTTQVSSSPLTMANRTKDIWTSSNKNVSWENHKVSIVHIYFDEDSTYARLRKELFGFTDLVANTGGLMGLCLGFSALSGVEVIYFLTLRNLWERKRKQSIKSKVEQLWRKAKRGHELNGRPSLMKSIRFLRRNRKQYHSLAGLRDNVFMVAPNKILNSATNIRSNTDLSAIDLLYAKTGTAANDYYNSHVWKSDFD